mmetsp:Transcript_30996/g.92227  ORF Transcript_30996/g.92227 Transcript_30996/m.92227 type:complete len:446 (+) Transcript_30996:629-1966(+)
MEPIIFWPTTLPTVLKAHEPQPPCCVASGWPEAGGACPPPWIRAASALCALRRSSTSCLTCSCKEPKTWKAASETPGSGSTSRWQTLGIKRPASSSAEKTDAVAKRVCIEADRQGPKLSLRPAARTEPSAWLALSFGKWPETLPQQITAFVRIDGSGSWSSLVRSFTTLVSTVLAFSRGTKWTSAFTVASRMGPLESVKPLTHSGKILSLIIASSRRLIISPSEVRSLKRMARSGDVKSWTTRGATFSLNSSSFRRVPIFRMAGRTCAPSWPGNFCAVSNSGNTCFVWTTCGTLSRRLGRPSKKASFCSGDLMCKLPRKDMTRTQGCCSKYWSPISSAIGLLPRTGPYRWSSAKGFRRSGGKSCASRDMSIFALGPRRPDRAEPKTYAAITAAPQKSTACVGAPPSASAEGGSGNPTMVGPLRRRAARSEVASAPLRQSSKPPSL